MDTSIPTPSSAAPSAPGFGPSMGSGLLSVAKCAASMVLVIFSVVIISAAIFTKQTTATGESGVHPVVAFCVFWISLLWLAMMEGGLNCMVGLQPVDKELYKDSHPRTFRCTQLAHRGDNIERFIVGRQYLDLTIVFTTSFMVSTLDGASVFGLPEIVNNIFLGSDLAVILCTIVFGQLVAQIHSASCMLDFVNNWVMVGSTYIALFVEGTGILHAVYLAQRCFTRLAGETVKTNEPPKSTLQSVLFWLRVCFSMSISILAIVVFMTALLGGNTPIREGIPKWVSIVSLFILLLLGGIMESLQIAFFAIKHLPANKVKACPRATRTLELIFKQNKLQAFLVGRQIAQTVIMFLIARIITIDMKEGEGNLFGVPDQIQAIFNSGLLNSLVSTIFASLFWRVTANAFPMLFLSNPVSIWVIRLCLLVEGTGVCDAAWVLARIHRRLAGFRPDVMFLGPTVLEGSNNSSKDDNDIEKQQQFSNAVALDKESTMSTSDDSDSANNLNEDSADESGYEMVLGHSGDTNIQQKE